LSFSNERTAVRDRLLTVGSQYRSLSQIALALTNKSLTARDISKTALDIASTGSNFVLPLHDQTIAGANVIATIAREDI
jgi:hypothetical protein